MEPADWLAYFNTRTEDFACRLAELAALPSASGDIPAINAFLDRLEQLLSPHHPALFRQATPAGDVLQMDFFSGPGPALVWLTHADTVRLDPYPLPVRREGNRLRGSGVYDMKQGLALFSILLDAFQSLGIRPSRPVRLLVNPDEETGSRHSRAWLQHSCAGARAVLLPEPSGPSGEVKIRRKGVFQLDLVFQGQAAHAGIEPEKGVDANRALVRCVQALDELTRPDPAVSFNPGLIAGGSARNVVSPVSRLTAEFRSFDNAALAAVRTRVKQWRDERGVPVTVETGPVTPALEFTEANRRLFERAAALAARLGRTLATCETGGASDGSHLSAGGCPVLDGIGLRGGGAHSADEWIDLDDFPFRAAWLASLVLRPAPEDDSGHRE